MWIVHFAVFFGFLQVKIAGRDLLDILKICLYINQEVTRKQYISSIMKIHPNTFCSITTRINMGEEPNDGIGERRARPRYH